MKTDIIRLGLLGSLVLVCLACVPGVDAEEIRGVPEIQGVYLESRTCQVYTGPCFANGESGLTGKEAMLAWGIESGKLAGVDLSGLNVVVVVNASDTLGFGGMKDAQSMKSVVIVDERANDEQRAALLDFVSHASERLGDSVVRVDRAPIHIQLDTATLNGEVDAGKSVKLRTRKARPDDCICSNEAAYYPPLAKVQQFAPGVALESRFNGKGLSSRWKTYGSRSAYMATFAY